MPPPIPGFYYDESRGRYFRVVGTSAGSAEQRYTQAAIVQDERVRKKQKSEYLLSRVESLAEKFASDSDNHSGIDDEVYWKYAMMTPKPPHPSQLRRLKLSNSHGLFYTDFKDKSTYQTIGRVCRTFTFERPPRSGMHVCGNRLALFYNRDREIGVCNIPETESDEEESYDQDLLTNLQYDDPYYSCDLANMDVFQGIFEHYEPLDANSDYPFLFTKSYGPWRDTLEIGSTEHQYQFESSRHFCVTIAGHLIVLYVADFPTYRQKYDLYVAIADATQHYLALSLEDEPITMDATDSTLFVGFRSGHIRCYNIKYTDRLMLTPSSEISVNALVTQIKVHDAQYLLVAGLKSMLLLFGIGTDLHGRTVLTSLVTYKEYHNDVYNNYSFRIIPKTNMFVVQSEYNNNITLQLRYMFYERPLQWKEIEFEDEFNRTFCLWSVDAGKIWIQKAGEVIMMSP